MKVWLFALIGIMAVTIVALLIKIHILQKTADEIRTAFTQKLITDTNTLIDISCNDKHMRNLANTINIQLRKLRNMQHHFRQGDMELKNSITNISHDLRTPLTAICGYLDLLENEEKSDSVERYIKIIRNRSDILVQLTEELFQYSVITLSSNDLIKSPTTINTVLEESIAAFYTALTESNIIPNIQITDVKVVRNLDSSALSRVFSNLLNNAIKYSDGDLDITLSETGEITFTNTTSDLNEIQAGKLFDRFYTVNSAQESTGLGLAIAKSLVKQMNGTISSKYCNNKLSICINFHSDYIK